MARNVEEANIVNDHDIERVVEAVLAKQTAPAAIEQAAEQAVVRVLASFGIEPDEHKELKLDLAHLRFWRKSFNRAGNVGVGAAVTTVVVGGLAFIGAGVRAKMGW